MTENYQLAIIGDGTTAVNAAHNLLRFTSVSKRLTLTIYGKNPESDCGRGFAYGPIGGAFGNLTESPADGCADYQPVTEGEFCSFVSRQFHASPEPIQCASRKSIGDFHHDRYLRSKIAAATVGGKLAFERGKISNLEKTRSGWDILGEQGRVMGHAHHVTLALGDILPQRFAKAVASFPGQVFSTPYHALQRILGDNRRAATVIAFGTRSSFVDLANTLVKHSRCRLIGVSTTGQISWLARTQRPAYDYRFLIGEYEVGKALRVKQVLKSLADELAIAQQNGCYVPPSLIDQLYAQSTARKPQPVCWAFDIKAEAEHAGGLTYHEIVMTAPWETIYGRLASPAERTLFDTVLSSFILYNRVNRIVDVDYRSFVAHIESGRVKIQRGSFDPKDIVAAKNGKIKVVLADKAKLTGDYVVNCAIGPAAAVEQAKSVPLLANLVAKGWLEPQNNGPGFRSTTPDLTLLGAQARTTSFSGIGLQSYGRHILEWTAQREPKIFQFLKNTSRQTRFFKEECHYG